MLDGAPRGWSGGAGDRRDSNEVRPYHFRRWPL